ncbi:MAG: response regulator [Pseudomonadales bacterium]|nr:response regulator [Pseudomonadales bacterium]
MSTTLQDPDQPYFSTTQAAKLLGVSLGTVQQMVEDGLLQAWKTAGGHRRILRESVEAHLARRGMAVGGGSGNGEVRILIAEDEPIFQELYEGTMTKWGLPLRIEIVDNGFDGLMAVGRHAPDVLIVDLMMPGMDGFEMIRALRANPALSSMDIIVVSAMEEQDIQARGGLPPDVVRYAKPIPFPELRGFFQAMVAAKHKTQRVLG